MELQNKQFLLLNDRLIMWHLIRCYLRSIVDLLYYYLHSIPKLIMNQKTTDELLHLLSSIDTEEELKEYTGHLNDMFCYHSFAEYLNDKILENGMSAASIIRDAQIQRTYGYQILNGTKNPGRDKVIAFSLALHLSLDDTQRALVLSGESILYSKDRRDSILIFSVQRKLSVQQANELLFDMDEAVL
jgi:hypothetical protein